MVAQHQLERFGFGERLAYFGKAPNEAVFDAVASGFNPATFEDDAMLDFAIANQAVMVNGGKGPT